MIAKKKKKILLFLHVSKAVLAFGITILPRKGLFDPSDWLNKLVMQIKNRFLVQNLILPFAVKFLAER